MPVETKIYQTDDGRALRRDFRECAASVDDGYIFIMTTEGIDFFKAAAAADKSDVEIDKLFSQGLEIRVFDEASEAKWFRAGIGKAYRFRRVIDEKETESSRLYWWDESQYLDIDTDRTERERKNGKTGRGEVCATGGGKYPLPVEEYHDTKIRIRNYLGEEASTGALYVKDWRLAGFGWQPETGKGGGV